MKVGRRFLIPAAAALVVAANGASAHDCARLTQVRLENTTIEKADWLAKGTLSSSALPYAWFMPETVELPVPVCRVQGTIKPAASSNIKFEVWLPREGWNGRYQQIGNGGLAGGMAIYSVDEDTPGVFSAIRAGYAAAVTDDGTAEPGPFASWQHRWLRDPERIADYGHRAVHFTARNAKALIEAFYGQPARYSYFTGASKGGQEAMMEAQRYPQDFDGIMAGMPGMDFTRLMVAMLWNSQAARKAGGLPAEKLQMLNRAVIAACSARAAVPGDNFLTEPLKCGFDPATLVCKQADGPDCLSPPQLEAVQAIYRGPVDPRTGKSLYPGHVPGSEGPELDIMPGFAIHGWTGYNGLYLQTFPIPIMSNVFRNPQWDGSVFDYGRDVAPLERALSASVDATNPDLEAFRARGGKLLMTTGWDDPLISPRQVIDYYEQVLTHQQSIARLPDRAAALSRTQKFFRFYVVPGHGHYTSFGVGPMPRRTLDDLAKWVEQGVAPDALSGEKFVDDDRSKGVALRRPLCAYPKVAHWNGVGSTREAASFSCQ